jgi:hypothetical protein
MPLLDFASRLRARDLLPLAVALACGVPAASASAAQVVRYATATPDTIHDCSALHPCDLVTAVAGAPDDAEVVVAPGQYDIASTLTDATNKVVHIHGAYGADRPTITSSTQPALVKLTNPASTVGYLNLEQTLAVAGVGVPALDLTSGLAEQLLVRGSQGDGACVVREGVLRDSVCVGKDNNGQPGVFVHVPLVGTDVSIRNVDAIGGPSGAGLIVDPVFHALDTQVSLVNDVIQAGPGWSLGDIYTFNDEGGTPYTGAMVVHVSHSNYETAVADSGPPVVDDGTKQSRSQHSLLFVNPTLTPVAGAAADDFHPLFGSPSIGAGVTAPADAGTFDLDHHPRASSPYGYTDIGALQAPDAWEPVPAGGGGGSNGGGGSGGGSGSGAGGLPGTTPGTLLPLLTKVSLSKKKFAVIQPPSHKAKKRVAYGTLVRFTLNEVATVRGTVQLKANGRITGKAKTCAKPSSKNRKGKKCTYWVKVGAVAFQTTSKGRTTGKGKKAKCAKPSRKNRKGKACLIYAKAVTAYGKAVPNKAVSLTFAGKVGRATLKVSTRRAPHAYRIQLVATDAAGHATAPVFLPFAILAG